MLSVTLKGIQAGLMISIGGAVFLSCENRYVGAVLFAVALLCICFKGYALFTGKVGYLAVSHRKQDVSDLLFCLLGNAIATILGGKLITYAIPTLSEAAFTICSAKLTQMPMQTFIRSVFCGMLMYLAVSIYRENKSLAGIFFAVPVFILSGFEHSIANMFYFSLSGITSFEAFVYLMLVVVGNSVGGVLLLLLDGKKKEGT